MSDEPSPPLMPAPETGSAGGLPPVPRTWWIGVAAVVGALVLIVGGVIIPVLGGGFPRIGHAMVHEDDPQTSVTRQGTVLVSTVPATRAEIEQVVTYTGTVLPLYEETVHPRVEGWLKAVYVDDGDQVKAGQVVAVLDETELAARAKAAQAGWTSASEGARGARQSVEAARAELRGNQAKLDAARSMVDEFGSMVTEAQHMLEMAQADYDAKSGGLREAQAMVAKAQAMLDKEKSMLDGKQSALESARASVQAATARQSAAQSKLEAARAKRAQAEAKRDAATAMVGEQEADLRSADADLTFKEGVFRRDDELHKQGAISDEEWDMSKRETDMSRGMRDAAAAKLKATQADLREAASMISEADAMEKEAASMLRESDVDIGKMESEAKMAASDVEAARHSVDEAAAEVEAAEGKQAMAEADLSGEKAAVDAARSRVDQASAKLQETRAMARESEAMVDRAHKMVLEAQAMERQAASMAAGAYEEYLAEQTVADYTTIRAQTSGTCTKREADPGTLVDPGMTIMSIATYDAVRVQVKVAEEHLAQLEPGDTAYVRIGDDPAGTVTTTVSTVFPNQEEETRTGTVEIVLDNAGLGLKKNSFAKVDLVLERHENALVVPSAAVQRVNDVPVAYVVQEGIAHQRELALGIDNGTMTEIVTGVDDGETVVVRNASLVTDGQAVSTSLDMPGQAAPSSSGGMEGMAM